MNLKTSYRQFLRDNLIFDFDDLKSTLCTFPHFCTFTDISDDYVRVNLTESSCRLTDSFNFIDYLENFIINKNNINNFYFFNKSKYILKLRDFKPDLSIDKYYISIDLLKFHLFFDGTRWVVFSDFFNDIKSFIDKPLFESYTLYELFFKYLDIFKIDINNLDKSRNYIFGLTTDDTKLLVNNNINKLYILSIVSKKDNRIIDITKNEINKISKYLFYNNKITFSSIKQLMNFIDNNYSYSHLYISNNIEYVIHFSKFKKRKKLLNSFIQSPYNLILYNYNSVLSLIHYLPALKFYINSYFHRTKSVIKYYHNLYKDVKINKKEDIIYEKYDKEIIMKIHNLYIRNNISINKDDVLFIIRELDIRKINEIFLRF